MALKPPVILSEATGVEESRSFTFKTLPRDSSTALGMTQAKHLCHFCDACIVA